MDDFGERTISGFQVILELSKNGSLELRKIIETIMKIQKEILAIKDYIPINHKTFRIHGLTLCNYEGGPDFLDMVRGMIEDSSIDCFLHIVDFLGDLYQVNLDTLEPRLDGRTPINPVALKASLSLEVLERHLLKYQPNSIDIQFIAQSTHIRNICAGGEVFLLKFVNDLYGSTPKVRLDLDIDSNLLKSLKRALLDIQDEIPDLVSPPFDMSVFMTCFKI